MEWSHEQQNAIELCCDTGERIVGITGGAGTGKSSILKEIYSELKKRKRVVLCAPTGRAAKRIQEVTGITAKTIHRLLEFPMPEDHMDSTEPKRCRQNPLEEDVIIVDEASMLGPTLYAQLMGALKGGAAVRFFGDNNQLPPVESLGDRAPPFKEVLFKYSSIELTFNFRSDDEIVANATRILRGSVPLRNSRFEIIYKDQPLPYALDFLTDEFSREDHQVIVPTRNGKYGTLRINPSLQARFNGQGPSLRLDRLTEDAAPLTVRANDKFLWIKNDYNLNMYNGEIGRITDIDTQDGALSLTMDTREQLVPARLKTWSSYHMSQISYDPRRQLELGYAVTTHKAQGSEFDTIVVLICAGHGWMLNRNNFYTAVTRAKKNVIVICDRRAMTLSMNKPRNV